MSTSARPPVLWQIKISHYNEKARWALDYKGVPHKRRSPMPLFGTLPVAWALTRGTTFPILTIDGEAIGDSTRIIAALEERFPEPSLYPADPAERQRALELEDFFDERLAPQVRLLVWNETTRDSRSFMAAALPDSRPLVRAALRPGTFLTAPIVRRHYGASEDSAREARRHIVAALERIESELGPSGYLVGDSFSVADLTAAALLTPLLQPPEHPYPPAAAFPEPLQEFCDSLSEMPGWPWALDVYRRHRKTSAEIGAVAKTATP